MVMWLLIWSISLNFDQIWSTSIHSIKFGLFAIWSTTQLRSIKSTLVHFGPPQSHLVQFGPFGLFWSIQLQFLVTFSILAKFSKNERLIAMLLIKMFKLKFL